MRLRQLWVDLQRPARVRLRPGQPLRVFAPAGVDVLRLAEGEPGQRQRVVRVAGKRLLVESLRRRVPLLAVLVELVACPRVELVGLQVVGRSLRQRGGFALGQVDLQRLGDPSRHVILHLEDGGVAAVVVFRPEVKAVLYIDQLRGDPQTLALPADAPLQNRGHSQLAAHLPRVHVLALVAEGRAARDHAQLSQLRERCDDLLGDSVAEVLVGGVSAQVEEGEHGDRSRDRLATATGQPAVGAAPDRPPDAAGKEQGAGERQDARRPATRPRLGDDRLQLAGLGHLFAPQPLRRQLERPGQHQGQREPEDGDERDGGGDGLGKPQGRNEEVRRLHHRESDGAVNGRDLEDVAPFQVGEDGLVASGSVRHMVWIQGPGAESPTR